MLKIAFDIGGVLSKHEPIRKLYMACVYFPYLIIPYIITDMHEKDKVLELLSANDIPCIKKNVYCADYTKYGEACKQILCDELEIDILIDDFIGYVANGKHVRLLVMPDVEKPYWSDDWKVENEAEFGRRCYKRPPGA